MKRALFTSRFSIIFVLAFSMQLTAGDYTTAEKDKSVEMVFAKADHNDDGAISWDEAEKACEEKLSKADRPETKHHGQDLDLFERETFEKADENGDDRLSRNEVATYLEEHGTTEKSMKKHMEKQSGGY